MDRVREEFPHNLEAEASVLSACLLNEEFAAIAIPQLSKNCFFNLTNQSVFVAMQQLLAKNRPTDMVTVRDYLKAKGSKVRPSDILSLNDNTFSLVCCKYHLELLKKYELQRRLIRAAVEIKAMAETAQEDIESVREQALEILMPLLSENESS